MRARPVDRVIYHLVVPEALRAGLDATCYRPGDLAATGFVHCAVEAAVLPVADDYFADVSGPVWLVAIDPGRLAAETRYEAPAPVEGVGRAHLARAAVFPHVYGPIDRSAITGVGVLGRTDRGFAWPDAMIPLEAFLSSSA